MAQAWSPAWMRRVLGLPELDTFKYKPDCLSMALIYVDLLDAPTKSGYKYVYKVGNSFQAKPYVKPGSQRSAGYFRSARAAAVQVFRIKMGYLPQPPSPKKGMNKHGMGRKPVPRSGRISKGGSARMPAATASPVSVLAEHVVFARDVQLDDAPPAGAFVVPCEPKA